MLVCQARVKPKVARQDVISQKDFREFIGETSRFIGTLVLAQGMRIMRLPFRARIEIATDTNAAQFRATWLRSASTSIRRKSRALAGLIVRPTSI
jgi:hypothetical protein